MTRTTSPLPTQRTPGSPTAAHWFSALSARRTIDHVVRTLAAFPDLAGCDRADLTALVRAGRLIPLPAGWTFVHEGTPADACFVLLEGQVHVLRGGVERATLGPGALLGEMGLLDARLRRASVVTGTVARVLRLEYPALAALLHTYPHLLSSVDAVCEQHRAADQRRSLADALPTAGA